MNKGIEFNKVYEEDERLRTPVSIRGDIVLYWFTDNELEIGKETAFATWSTELFLKNNKLYKKPMTFQRIKDEGIKTLADNIGQQREVIGFASDGSLVTYMTNWGAAHWYESEVKEWEAV